MKIVFMGTPDFAVEPLKALIAAGHSIELVLTRVDKPKGRGYELIPTPVKEEALKHGIRVLQPVNLKEEGIYEELCRAGADVFVVVAYGRLLPKNILDIPRLGCVNIHASLLPSYRGAAPVQWAVIDGREKSGITTMLMDEGLDTGDILRQYEIEISKDETGGSLFERLAKLGAEAIVDTLEAMERGDIEPVKQGETDTQYAAMLKKEHGNLDFSKTAAETERLIRGLNPWPGTYSYLNSKVLKLWKAELTDTDSGDRTPGELIVSGQRLYIAFADKLLEIKELQLEGRKRMSAPDFIRGYKPEEEKTLLKRRL